MAKFGHLKVVFDNGIHMENKVDYEKALLLYLLQQYKFRQFYYEDFFTLISAGNSSLAMIAYCNRTEICTDQKISFLFLLYVFFLIQS